MHNRSVNVVEEKTALRLRKGVSMKAFSAVVLGVLLLGAASPAWGDAMSNIQFDPGSVSAMRFNDRVDITFDYDVQTAGGVRIFARPFTEGSLTPNYAASGSPLYPEGTGTGSAYFTIQAGNTVVDDVRFQIWNADQTVMLLEFFVPVTYYYGEHGIFNIQMSPESPSSVKNYQFVDISFEYATVEPGGVRIWARPMTGGSLSPNYGASGSPLYPSGTGSGTGNFTITMGDCDVDAVRFQMWDDAQTNLLLELFVPVDYQFRAASVYNVSTTPSSPAGWLFNDNVTVDFSYQADQPVRIWARPFTNGSLTPNYGASGSPLYPSGTGTGSGTFTITSGEVTVDAIRFQVWDDAQTTMFLEYFVPVDFHFNNHVVVAYQLDHPAPAYFTCEHDATMEFLYYTTEPTGVRIWAHPYKQGSYAPGAYYQGSPTHPTGSGVGTTYVGAWSPVLVDGLFWLMTDADQTVTLMEWLTPTHLQFGSGAPSSVSPEEMTRVHQTMFAAVPNPMRLGSTLRYALPADAEVSLRVFDLEGREHAVLIHGSQPAGTHSVKVDEQALGSGIYFCRLDAVTRDGTKAYVDIERLVLVK